HIYPDFPTD
nr:Chain K, P39 [synthetic construct]